MASNTQNQPSSPLPNNSQSTSTPISALSEALKKANAKTPPPPPPSPAPQPVPPPVLTSGGRTVLSTTALINQRKGTFAHKHRHSTAHLQALGALRSILIPPPTISPPSSNTNPTKPNSQSLPENSTLASSTNKEKEKKKEKEPTYTEKQYEIAKLAAKYAGRKRVEEVDLDFARRFEEVLMGWAKRLEDNGSP